MPLTIIMDNLANLSKHVDAIVNLCHPTPGEIGTGVDAAIHAKAGPRLRQRLAELPRLHVGEFHYTDGYDLTNALGEKVAGIFHVRGPLWQNGALGEEHSSGSAIWICWKLHTAEASNPLRSP